MRARIAPRFWRTTGGLALLLCALNVHAGEVLVAVAANFAAPIQKIATAFEKDTGNKLAVIVGSTGKHYAQIKNDAPFEVLLAADAATPKRLEDEGLTVVGQRFTYAVGKLVLFSAKPGFVDDAGAVLKAGGFAHLALANPQTAPYGTAAKEVLQSLGLYDTLQAKIVQGESIAQTFEFVVSGNAELGFVALSQVAPPDRVVTGSWWLVPPRLYSPIRQDAVLLKKGAANPAARAFLQYLRSDTALAVIRAYGYEI